MEREKQTFSPPAGVGRPERKLGWQRCRWLVLFVMLMLSGFVQTAQADTPRWFFTTQTLDVSNPYIDLGIYVLEDNDAWSYWSSDASKPFKLSLNGYPIVMDGFIVGRDGTNSWKSRKSNALHWYSHWYEYNYSYGASEGGVAGNTYVWYNSDEEYWATLILIPQYIFIGHNIELRANGYWKNNKTNNAQPYYTSLTYSLPHNGKAPSSVSLTRSNGKINVGASFSGCNTTNYEWSASLFTQQIGETDWEDSWSGNSVGNGTEPFNTNGKAEIEADNYKSYTVYPRLTARYIDGYSYKVGSYYMRLGLEGPIMIKDYSVMTVKGYPRAANVEVVGDKWTRKNTITWQREIYDQNNVDLNGGWCIYRENTDGTFTALTTVGKDITSYTVSNVEFDVPNTYYVCWVPNDWTVSKPSDAAGLWAKKTYTLTRSFNFSNATATSKETSVSLSWGNETPGDGSQQTFKVWRVLNRKSLQTNGKADKKKVVESLTENDLIATITSSGTTTSFEDTHLANNMTLYLYVVSVEAFGQTWYSDVIGPKTLSGHTEILNVTANRGTYSNVVKVQWDVKHVGTEGTRYVVYRRLLGSEGDGYGGELLLLRHRGAARTVLRLPRGCAGQVPGSRYGRD